MTKLTNEKIHLALEQAKGLERDYMQEIMRSRKLAWRIAWGGLAIACVATLSIFGLTPLKEPPEMYVVRVDNATGVIEQVSRLGLHEEDYGERVTKYFLNQYVLNCEGYNWYSIQYQHDTCLLLSGDDTQRAYSEKFKGPNALDTKLGSHTNIDVDVHSITMSNADTAVIRFSTTERDTSGMRSAPPKHQLATVSYQFINASMTEDIARVNPLGFQVLRYRVDADLSRQ